MTVIGCWLSTLLLVQGAGQAPLSEKGAAPTIPYERAAEFMDRTCYVTGKVVLTRNIGSRCFLNFHEDIATRFTVVINQTDFGKFPEPPETLYRDKDVKVFGRIVEYRGKPEIVVTEPDQIVLLNAPATAPATRPAATRAAAREFTGVVRIATYNVLNLFDDVDDPYTEDEGTPTKPREELETLAATIRAVDADVLALEEVENRGYLERFVGVLLPDMGYDEIVLFEGNNSRGIDVAVLSRFPVGPVTSHRHLKFPASDGKAISFQRDLLRVRIEPPGARPFDVFVTHLKSKEGQDDTGLPIRLGEAAAIRRILDGVLAEAPDARFVLCGDFNDTLDSKPLRTILGEGATALTPRVDDVPEAQRISFNKEPYRSMIDFIFCSPAMSKCYRKGSYRIRQGTVEASGSDHNPVAAEFDLH